MLHRKYGNIMEYLDLCRMRAVRYTSTKLHFANSWVRKPLKYTPLSVYVRESAHGHCLGALFSSAQLTAFAVLLLADIKQHCITAGAPFWVGGELLVFVVRPHATNKEVRTVVVRYEYMYRVTLSSYILHSFCLPFFKMLWDYLNRPPGHDNYFHRTFVVWTRMKEQTWEVGKNDLVTGMLWWSVFWKACTKINELVVFN